MKLFISKNITFQQNKSNPTHRLPRPLRATPSLQVVLPTHAHPCKKHQAPSLLRASSREPVPNAVIGFR